MNKQMTKEDSKLSSSSTNEKNLVAKEPDLELGAVKSTADTRSKDSAHTSHSTDETIHANDDNPPNVPPEDPNIVWWNGDKDPDNPHNWPLWRKYVNCGLISVLTLITPLASSVFAPGVPSLVKEFKTNNSELAAFVVSVYVLGFAIGPMLLAPLSEMYGRVPIYHVCNACFFAFTVACAEAPTFESLIVFRFFAGCFGAAPMTNGAGTIADMFRPEERVAVMAAFSMGPLLGPIIGPVIGGVLSDEKGWRWSFWVVVIVSGAVFVTMIFTLQESFAPVILQRRVVKLRKEKGNDQLRSKLDSGLSDMELLKRCIVRPSKLLVFSPICTVFALYVVVIYGYLYLLFTSIPFVFQKSYGFSASTVGLVYIGLGVGSFIGIAWFSMDSRQQQANNTITPEMRLKLLPAAAIIFPIGFFIYGWTADYKTHWIGPVIGLAVIGVGNLVCFMCITMYLVDAYETYSASALAANTIMRSIAGALLPLCGLKMYDSLGLGWGNSLLGFIAVGLIPIPFLIQRYGEKLRKKFDMSRI